MYSYVQYLLLITVLMSTDNMIELVGNTYVLCVLHTHSHSHPHTLSHTILEHKISYLLLATLLVNVVIVLGTRRKPP